MDIGRMLTWTADRYPGRTAVGGSRPLTYRQWDARTNQLARALADLGVRPADAVAYLLAGGEPMASLHLAAQKLGAAAVPLSIRFGAPELSCCVRDAEPRLVIGDDSTHARLAGGLAGGPPVLDRTELDRRAAREPDGELPTKNGTETDLSVILRSRRARRARSRCRWPARRRSAATARGDADARAIRDGWYLTGDLAAEDGDGDLWVSGRVDDMINSGGENLDSTFPRAGPGSERVTRDR